MSLARLLILAAGCVLLVQLPAGYAQVQRQGSAYRVILSPTDQTFLTYALKASRFQVDLARVASVRGSHERTKAFAQLMIDDHTKMNSVLDSMAKKRGVLVRERVPMPVKLIGLKGRPFDHDYSIMVVEDHEKLLAAFRSEAQSGIDPELKNFASKNIDLILWHLDLGQRLKP